MLLQQFINGITIGSTYALVAIGFTMIFGVLELTNFSNSSLYMFGAYVTWLLYGVGINFFVAFALSIALTGLLGACGLLGIQLGGRLLPLLPAALLCCANGTRRSSLV